MSKPIIGLVGGIGSGKSAVAEEFARRGSLVIHADQLGHEALVQPDIRDRAVARWGTGILGSDGQIVRKNVAAIVFKDEAELKALESMVFPHIEKRCREEIAKGQADTNVSAIVLDAAIMLEAGWDKICDRIVFIDVPREIRLRRLQENRGWDAAELERREKAQLPLEAKRARADLMIDNSAPRESLGAQVDRVMAELQGDAGACLPTLNSTLGTSHSLETRN